MRISMLVWLAIAGAPLYSQTAVKLRVDATDAPSRLFHVRMTMAVKAGPMTLLYPEWIPGEHGPTGPIVNLVGPGCGAPGHSAGPPRPGFSRCSPCRPAAAARTPPTALTSPRRTARRGAVRAGPARRRRRPA